MSNCGCGAVCVCITLSSLSSHEKLSPRWREHNAIITQVIRRGGGGRTNPSQYFLRDLDVLRKLILIVRRRRGGQKTDDAAVAPCFGLI